MSASRFSWLALIATIAACSLVDGGLFVLVWWLAGDFLVGMFGFLMLGGPITLFMAGPTYTWFKGALGGRAVA
jgi:hypothetical protein